MIRFHSTLTGQPDFIEDSCCILFRSGGTVRPLSDRA